MLDPINRVRAIVDLPIERTNVGAFLGISYNGRHDSSVALINPQGDLVYAASEERFTRVRQDGRFPQRALARIEVRSLAGVGVPYLEAPCNDVISHEVFRPLLHDRRRRVPPEPFPPEWHERLTSLDRPLAFFDHHQMHAYTGFYLSGYSEAFAFTADHGSPACPTTMGLFHVTHGQITPLAIASARDRSGLAEMYSNVTALLGFTACRDEHNITSLAARGLPSRQCRDHLWKLVREIQHADPPLYDWVGSFGNQTPPALETNRRLVDVYRTELPYPDADIARAAQDLLNERLITISRWLGDVHGFGLPLILSGGLFANTKSNMHLAMLGFPKIFVAPPMGDEGVAIGAAAAAHDQIFDRPGCTPEPVFPRCLLVGPTPGRGLTDRLRDLGIHFKRPPEPDLAEYLASALAAGEVVAIVRGPQEFGPRALGHRSILAAPVDTAINERLNAHLRRTESMPFPAVVRTENIKKVFEIERVASHVGGCLPFITMSLPTQSWVADVAPAVVEVDGTALPQLVDSTDDPFLHLVLSLYEKLTGVPVLVSTNFSVDDGPLVSSVDDALVGCLTAGLDVLCLQDHLITLAANRSLYNIARLLQRNSR